ncbi:MAG: methylenetetrahydrofolate reductase [Nitrososphaerales archaeon]|nr:methylenetetrahydrofolate reductase [Nitrososphaerales archaeon]
MPKPTRPFTSIVEVFPPNFSADKTKEPMIGLRQKTRDFVERVKRLQQIADAILVADVKDTGRLKLSTVHSAALLKEMSGVDAIPVITARDSNRPAVLSSVVTAFSMGLTSLMIVWGDRYGTGEGAKNVYDFASVSELLGQVRDLSVRSNLKCRLLAPVDLSILRTERGLRLAKDRLKSGADLLLAQPPTTDAETTLPKHARLLTGAGLDGRVLLNVFPFRDEADVEGCRKKFGWDLPPRLDRIAREGERALLKEARGVAAGVRGRGLAGVYVSTRGKPEHARFILD